MANRLIANQETDKEKILPSRKEGIPAELATLIHGLDTNEHFVETNLEINVCKMLRYGCGHLVGSVHISWRGLSRPGGGNMKMTQCVPCPVAGKEPANV